MIKALANANKLDRRNVHVLRADLSTRSQVERDERSASGRITEVVELVIGHRHEVSQAEELRVRRPNDRRFACGCVDGQQRDFGRCIVNECEASKRLRAVLLSCAAGRINPRL